MSRAESASLVEPATIIRNPVLRGFAPDPSFIRVGEWYFIAVSSFEWFPTIPLFRSRDLVRWEYAGHVEGAIPGNSLAGYPDSGAIWAPALSHADRMLWVTYSVVESMQSDYFNLDTFVIRAELRDGGIGVWSAPIRVSSHGFDPSLFHHEGRHWLLNLQNDHRPGGDRFAGIVLTELAADGDDLCTTGPTRLLLQSPKSNLLEGPKVLAKDGWFYLILAEGGTGTNHGVLMARSRALDGPYELDSRPLLTTRDDLDWPLQKAGHGELAQSADGRWFLAHLVSRPIATSIGLQSPLGRETAIQEVVWDADGWPRLAQGDERPLAEIRLSPPVGTHLSPQPKPPATLSPATIEPASRSWPGASATLAWPWSSLRGYATADWAEATASGAIRLRGRQGIESLRKNSLIGQRLTEAVSEARVTIRARPHSFSQSAGLSLWYNTSAYITLQLTWCEPAGESQRGQQFEGLGSAALVLTSRSIDGARIVTQQPVDASTAFTLGVRLDNGRAQFSAGSAVQPPAPFGPELDAAFLSDDFGPSLRFTGTFAALNAVDLIDERFTAEFTDFRLSTAFTNAS